MYIMMNQLLRPGGCCSAKEMFFGHDTLCKHTFLVSFCVHPINYEDCKSMSKLSYCLFQNISIMPLVQLIV